MDFHGLIVIACVFLASLFSLLFINKFFRGKTFEEVAAEKKLLAEKLYGTTTKAKRQVRKVSNKKVKDKKQKSKDSQKDVDVDSQNESDTQVESQSADSSPSHKKDAHVEFLEPTVVNDSDGGIDPRKNTGNKLNKRKGTTGKLSNTGILINKNEEVVVKEDLVTESLNTIEINPPKDVLETKKMKDSSSDTSKNKSAGKDSKKVKQNKKEDDRVEVEQQQELGKGSKDSNKPPEAKKETKQSDGTVKKEAKSQPESVAKKDIKPQQQQQQQPQQEATVKKESKQQQDEVVVKKEVKPLVEKQVKTNDTQKSQNNKTNKKKKNENTAIAEKLDNTDLTNVSSLISVLGRAELTRNEIQILIDFLLNKQQDTLSNHSEWSDDVVQKLRKQLAEKEKALQEEQEASAGIQAKLRELRGGINSERAQNSAHVKACLEEIQAKNGEIRNLTQELENIGEKFNIEKQKFQAKIHEIQNNSQDFLAQIHQLTDTNNILKAENLEKNDLIREFQLIANASRQSDEETKQKLNEIIQHNNNRVMELEINLKEAEKQIARQLRELEVAKMLEKDKDNNKVEIRNLQNALDSAKAELNLTINSNKQHNESLLKQIDELNAQLGHVKTKYVEQSNQTTELNTVLNSYKKTVTDLEEELSHYKIKLNTLVSKEDELMKQIKEEKEKNNELRMKNWKLIDALQKAETLKPSSTNFNNLGLQPDSTKARLEEQNRVRELFQRLFPEAASAAQSLAFSISFDQWVEQVAKNIKQHNNKLVTDQINNRTKLNSEYSNNHMDSSNHHEENNENSSHKNSENDTASKDLILQNAQLKAHITELTSIVTKTENMLRNLEAQAGDQEAHWRSVVQSKEEEINILRNSREQAT